MFYTMVLLPNVEILGFRVSLVMLRMPRRHTQVKELLEAGGSGGWCRGREDGEVRRLQWEEM